MARKKRVNVLAIVLIVILLGFVGFATYNLLNKPSSGLAASNYIYCNDYEFTCCNIRTTPSASSIVVGATDHFMCPMNSVKCTITNVVPGGTLQSGPYFTVGSKNCRQVSGLLGLTWWECDDQRQILFSTAYDIKPGDYVWSGNIGYKPTVYYTITNLRLDFCGRAGCTQGQAVVGADGCTFVFNKVKDENGNLLSSDKSYTVATQDCVLSWQTGDRHICGDVNEQCNTDSECAMLENCNARTLQTYGCVKSNLPSMITNVNGQYIFDGTNTDTNLQVGTINKSVCAIKSAVTVQCCGDTDCGANAFCDKTTHTCQAHPDCVYDTDCGVSQQCDIDSKTIRKPACILGKCGYKTVSQVQCCTSSDCSSNQFCNVSKQCEISVNPRVACPFDCCPAANSNDDQKYFSKMCATGLTCLSGNTCSATPPNEECKWYDLPCLWKKLVGGSSCAWWDIGCKLKQFTLIVVAIGFVLALLFAFDFLGGIFKEKRQLALRWIFAVILAALVAYLIFAFFWYGVALLVIFLILKATVSAIIPIKGVRRRR